MPDILVVIFFVLVMGIIMALLNARRFTKKIQEQERVIKDLRGQADIDRAQSTTERSELNVILSSMVEGVLVVGKDEKIQYISPNLSDMFDFRSKEVTARPYWEVIPYGQIISAIKEVLIKAIAVSREITLFGKDDVFFNIQISPVIHEGKLVGAVAVFHDISELKKLLRMRGEFVANVSHELKTPLTSIKGYVETLSQEGILEDIPTVLKFLKVIHKQTLRLESLVKDLLTLSSIESKEVIMDIEPCEVSVIITGAMSALKDSIGLSQHKITVTIADDLPKVIVDCHRIEQVLINLLENAIKFTQSAGIIKIVVTLQSPFIRIDVIDNGIGISSEHLPRLFERFYRVDKARSSEIGGTGLGLAIVKHIILAHHGRVEVQSRPGLGTTFSFFIPSA